MVLVDTSVWIDFLRQGNDHLKALLEEGEVATHSLVIGELHVGNISKREDFLSLLGDLPKVGDCSHEEVLFLINRHKLYGIGIGYFDAHILCSSVVHNTPLWTLDQRLAKQAEALAGC
jgi:predicted nucleic acid-binding protein